MTGEQMPLGFQHQDLEQTRYYLAVKNKSAVKKDMETMCKFVREFLFFTVIHDARGAGTNPKDEIMSENGMAFQQFLLAFTTRRNKISNLHMVGSSTEEYIHYLKFLWNEGLQAKGKVFGKYNIRKALSNEKSAVYACIAEAFKSKYTRGLLTNCVIVLTTSFFPNFFHDTKRTST